ncbi:MAG: hypothetical protein QXW98_05800 [Candidatus Caldarchaeum sp.]
MLMLSRSSFKSPYKQLGFFQQVYEEAGGLSGIIRAIGSMFRIRRISKEQRRLQREASLFSAALSGVSSENRMREAAFQASLMEYLKKKEKAEKRKGLENWSRYAVEQAGAPEGALPYYQPYDFNVGEAPKPEDYSMSADRLEEWRRRINRLGSV